MALAPAPAMSVAIEPRACTTLPIDEATRQLHRLWWCPGGTMAAGWWSALDLTAWRAPYARQLSLRPALDALLARKLGHDGPPPHSALAAQLLTGPRDAVCVGLGLWAMQCPDYLTLRPYRAALAAELGPAPLAQLQALLPGGAAAPGVEPAALAALARAHGAAWLAAADDPALALCALLWEPSDLPAPAQPLAPILHKLLRWL